MNFNREVAEDAALYWTKEQGSLAALIDACDHIAAAEADVLGSRAKKRIESKFSWQSIADQYRDLFL